MRSSNASLLLATVLLATGCGAAQDDAQNDAFDVDPGVASSALAKSDTGASVADAREVQAAPIPTVVGPLEPRLPPLCPTVPLADVTEAFHWPGGLGGFAGTQATSGATYGDLCSPYLVVETTNAKGQHLPLEAEAVVDGAMHQSSLACALAKVVVEGWGRKDSLCIKDGKISFCSEWVSLGKKEASGVWDNTHDWFPPCGLATSLPTLENSPYSVVRLGARAYKRILQNGSLVEVKLPVTARIGFYQIN